MNRRSFLTTLAAGATAAFSLDPERALWIPGAKLISIPAPTVVSAPVFISEVWTRANGVWTKSVYAGQDNERGALLSTQVWPGKEAPFVRIAGARPTVIRTSRLVTNGEWDTRLRGADPVYARRRDTFEAKVRDIVPQGDVLVIP